MTDVTLTPPLLRPPGRRSGRLRLLRAATPWLVWCGFLLVPTLAFKQAYLEAMWAGKGSWWSDAAAADPGDSPTVRLLLGALHLVRSDILAAGLVVAAAGLVGVGLLRLPLARVAAATTLVAVLAGGAHWLSLSETGQLLTPEIGSVAWRWAATHPGVVLEFHPYRTLALLLAAVGWTVLLRRMLDGLRARTRRPHPFAALAGGAALLLAGAAALLLAGAVVASALDRRRAPRADPASRAFWWSALAAFRRDGGEAPLPPAPARERLLAGIGRTLYPAAAAVPAASAPIVVIPAERLRPRHVLVLILETAPGRYYPLSDDPRLRTFAAMSREAIVAERHHATRPLSVEANFSLLSGLYPRVDRAPEDMPGLRTDGLAAVLGAHGWESTYIDAYRLDWRGGSRQRRLWTEGLGFDHIVEIDRRPGVPSRFSYAGKVARERAALREALARIDRAERGGRKALAVVATAIGHYDWPAAPGNDDLPAARRIRELARVHDRLMGELLDSLDARGLRDSVLVAVTGDHGLRYEAEFASLGEPRRQVEARFRVPFLLYAPGLLSEAVRLSHVTSHVDVTPTLLTLTGVPTDGLVHHGRHMLDSALARRVVFMLNSRLAPFDYVRRGNVSYELDHVTRRTTRLARPRTGAPAAPAPAGPAELGAARAAHDSARSLFDLTAAYFLQPRPASP